MLQRQSLRMPNVKKPQSLRIVRMTEPELIEFVCAALGDGVRSSLDVVARELRKERPYDSLAGRQREEAWDTWRGSVHNARRSIRARRDALLSTLVSRGLLASFDLTAAGGTRWLFVTVEGCEQLLDRLLEVVGDWTYSSNADGYYFGVAPVEAVIRNRNLRHRSGR